MWSWYQSIVGWPTIELKRPLNGSAPGYEATSESETSQYFALNLGGPSQPGDSPGLISALRASKVHVRTGCGLRTRSVSTRGKRNTVTPNKKAVVTESMPAIAPSLLVDSAHTANAMLERT